MTRHYIIPIFVPHYGCPHDCVFCNQKKITGLETDVTVSQVEKIIVDHLATFKDDSYIEVAFYGGSFTAIDIDLQRKLLKIPREFKERGLIDGIRLSTRPDSIDVIIFDMLKENLVDTIELGVQSLDSDVLRQSERGHTAEDVWVSSQMIKDKGFKLGLQLMTGLPGDTHSKSIYSARGVLSMEPDFIRIYPTLVIKGTVLEKMFLSGLYSPQTLDEAVETACDILILAESKNIKVIRIGLQPTENIQEGKDVVGGPFHSSIRQLVESRLLIRLIERYIHNEEIPRGKNWTLFCPKGYSSVVSGQRGSNRVKLSLILEASGLKIIEKELPKDHLILETDGFIRYIDLQSLKLDEATNIA